MERNRSRKAFTLIELLIVMAIILLLSAATLPVVWGVIKSQEITGATQVVQSTLAGVRDSAIRSRRPHGIRLILDPDLNTMPSASLPSGGAVAANRIQFLEPAPDYSEGKVTLSYWQPDATNFPDLVLLRVDEYKVDNNGLPQPPTGWYYNIRQGDKIRFTASGREYRIVGPLHDLTAFGGPVSEWTDERFVNLGPDFRSYPGSPMGEFLILLNGTNDDGKIKDASGVADGYVDEAFDGIDNNGSGVIDPGFPGPGGQVRPLQNMLAGWNPNVPRSGQYEIERFFGQLPVDTGEPVDYTIIRRPLPSRDGKEIQLPGNIVIDLTTSAWLGHQAERSRVPIDPISGYVDLMFYPNGQVVPSTPYGLSDELTRYPFYHLWLTKREDVYPPMGAPYPRLGMPVGVAHPYSNPNQLRADRRLISINSRTGATKTSPLTEDQFFSTVDPNAPYAETEGRVQGVPIN